MNSPLTFPEELLNQPAAARVNYFASFSIQHPHLAEAYTKVRRIMRNPSGISILFVVGVSGVGKSFLKEWLTEEVESEWATVQSSEPDYDKARIPIAGITIPAHDRRMASLKEIYMRMLRSLKEPCVENKIGYPSDPPLISYLRTSRGTISAYNLSVENALDARRPQAYYFDEAQHLIGYSMMRYQDYMNWIKSLSNLTKVLFILIGTYDLLNMLELNEQLMRRSQVVPFRRYSVSEEDQTHFASSIYSFQLQMPFPREPDLIRYSDYLYSRTGGCVGTLYEWFLRAISYAYDLEPKAQTLTLHHLEETAPIMSDESAKVFIERMEAAEQDFQAFLRCETNTEEIYGVVKEITHRKQHVGRRKPCRDKVGI